jgi:hypothetical protein
LLGLVVALALGLATTVASLTGLLSDARVAGSPRSTHSPEPALVPDGVADVADLVAAAWITVAGSAASDWVWTDAPHWQAMADTLAVHWRVLSGPDPLGRVEGEGIPGTPDPPPYEGAGLSRAEATLVALAGAEWTRARSTQGLESAWWAGLAGATDQLRARVQASYQVPGPINPLATLAAVPEPEAFAHLVETDHAAVYTATAVLGSLPPNHALRPSVLGLLEQFRRHRDGLQDLAEANAWTIPAAAPAYALPELTDDGSAQAALGQAVDAIAEGAISWLAATTGFRDRAADEVQWIATLWPSQTPSIWVGWPD